MKLSTIKKLSKGFTLIELLTVVTIIVILATVAGVNYKNSRIKARDARRKQDLSTYSSAVESYFDDYNYYPKANSSAAAVTILANWNDGVIEDPETGEKTEYNPGDINYLQQIVDDPLVRNLMRLTKLYEGAPIESRYVKAVKRKFSWYTEDGGYYKAGIFCRYSYWGGGAEKGYQWKDEIIIDDDDLPNAFEYLISACIENPAETLPRQDGGINPWRYEIGPGRDHFYLCGIWGAFAKYDSPPSGGLPNPGDVSGGEGPEASGPYPDYIGSDCNFISANKDKLTN